jgi:regulator of replication initiation timing
MADEESQRAECAFKTLLNITAKIGNLRKDLRNDILESVSILRKVLSNLKSQLDITSDENKEPKVEVKKTWEAMVERRDKMRDRWRHLWTTCSKHQAVAYDNFLHLPEGRQLFSEVLKGGGDKRYKITLKAKDNEKSPEQIQLQLKEINPTGIKVGIKTFKTLRDGRVIIET